MSQEEKDKYKEYLKKGKIPGFGERRRKYQILLIKGTIIGLLLYSLASMLFSCKSQKCLTSFKEGAFFYGDTFKLEGKEVISNTLHEGIYLVRKNNIQTEYIPKLNVEIKYAIKWKSNSKYILTQISESYQSLKKGDIIKAKIIESKDTYYIYRSIKDGIEMEGKLYKRK